MKIEDVKVGDKVLYQCNGEIDIGVVTEVGASIVWAKWEGSGLRQYSSPELLSLIEAAKFPLANTKINVQKYADDNGLTLSAAHKEVQEWLFGQGYEWCFNKKEVSFTHGKWLEMGIDSSSGITWADDGEEAMGDCKEITLQRTVAVTLTPSFVEEAVEYVELGGRKYVKADLEEALSKIRPVGVPVEGV